MALILLPVLANAVSLSGIFNADPQLASMGLGVDVRAGWLSGPMGWFDPSVGSITQPLGQLVADDWLHGIIPWWNPYSGVGMPLAAEMQSSAFFLPFVLLLHFHSGWLLLRVVLQMFCGLFTYALFVGLGLTRTAACLGGALYGLTPLFFLCPSAPIAALPFLPLLLLGIEQATAAAARGKTGGWSLIIVAGTYAFYASNPEMVYLDGLLAGVWALWRLACLPSGRARWRLAGRLGLAVVISAGLCAPLLVAFVAYLKSGYTGIHGLTGLITMAPSLVPLQIMPFFYGLFATPPPPGLNAALGPAYVRMPGWVDLPVLTLALTALVRPGRCRALRFVLAFWVALWEARYLGVAPVMALMNAIPGLALVDATRYSGAAVGFALITLACLAFDDLQRGPALSRRRLALVLAAVSWLATCAVAPMFGFVRTWYAMRPQDMLIALAAAGFAASVIATLSAALLRRRFTRALAALLLVGPLTSFIIPQFAGLRGGHVDLAPIRFLQRHIGTGRMVSAGPLAANFNAGYGIASINHFALPVPRLWTDYLASTLFPELAAHLVPARDLTDYGDGSAAQDAAVIKRLAAYEEVAVRYVVTPPGELTLGEAFTLASPQAAGSAVNLVPGGADITGTIPAGLPLRSVGSMSVDIGTYGGGSNGPLVATLCAAAACSTATAETATATDDTPLLLTFATPLAVPRTAVLTYRLRHPSGTMVAIWLAPGANGPLPLITLFPYTEPGALPTLVFHDQAASIFELPHPAAFAQASDNGCAVKIESRQTIITTCPHQALLLRRELYDPGWSARVNGKSVTVTQSGLFQTVPVSAGLCAVTFSYAPSHIRLTGGVAVLAAMVWLASGPIRQRLKSWPVFQHRRCTRLSEQK